jgi:hypothetical protein
MSNNWMGPSSRGEGRYATAAVCLKGDVSTPDIQIAGEFLSLLRKALPLDDREARARPQKR